MIRAEHTPVLLRRDRVLGRMEHEVSGTPCDRPSALDASAPPARLREGGTEHLAQGLGMAASPPALPARLSTADALSRPSIRA